MSLYHTTHICRALLSLVLAMGVTSNVVANTQNSIKPTQLPNFFEKNLGQFDNSYTFIAHNHNSYFAFAPQHVSILLAGQMTDQQLILQFPGANQQTVIEGEKQRKHVINYLRGNKHSLHNIPTFSYVRYREVYPGIDAKFYFNDSLLEYDFIVAPHANPQLINVQFERADKVSISENGELVITIGSKTLIQRPPVSYQQIDDKRIAVNSYYRLHGNNVKIALADYDTTLPLVIDPIIEFSSYFGGEWEDQGSEIAADSQGNIWLAGASSSKIRITRDDLLTLENTAVETLQDSDTVHYYQDSHGVAVPDDFKNGVTVDIDNEKSYVVVDGEIQESEFIYQCRYRWRETNREFDNVYTDYDVFLSKFTPQMEPVFTTYFGGCGNDGVRDMAIDGNDNVYLVGFTLSENFPVKSPVQSTLSTSRFASEPIQADGFYAKFDNDGGQVFTSYLGGDGRDGLRGVAVDDEENVYLTGYSHSTNLPTQPCSSGSITTIGCENVGGIDETAVNQGNNEISLYADAFVAKISPQGDAIRFLSYFGGEYDDWGESIALQSDGVVIAGNSASTNLPENAEGYSYSDKNRNFVEKNNQMVEEFCSRVTEVGTIELRVADAHVCEDIFLAKLSLDGTQLMFSTYLGGNKDDNISDLKVDSNDNLYIVGTTRSQGVQLADGKPETLKNSTLNERYPLYKHLRQFNFDPESLSTMAFFTILNPTATELLMSSFISADDDDAGTALALYERVFNGATLTEADVFIGGHTVSPNFYTENGFHSRVSNSDIFVVKLALNLEKLSEPFGVEDKCDKNSCDLYELKYSTLIGGESLDSLKQMSYDSVSQQLLLTGMTFSTKLPVTTDANKNSIKQIQVIEYDPTTRNIIDQFSYYPSDSFMMKISDVESTVDLQIVLTESLPQKVDEDTFISYKLSITNLSATEQAKSVRLLVNFPQLGVLEKLPNYVKYDLNDCALVLKNLYCVIGDLAASEQVSMTVDISARHSGTFVTSFSASSMTSDINMSNNAIETSVSVKAKTSSASLHGYLLFSCVLLLLMYRIPFARIVYTQSAWVSNNKN